MLFRSLGFHSGEETAWFLRIVAYHHEMIIQLRKDGLNSLSEAFVSSPGCAGWDRLVIEAINYAKKRGIYIGK